MTADVKVPVLPESVAEATVVAWHKQVGESVRRDENLVDIETDKVILEVPATCDGVVTEILEDVDAIVTAGQVLAKITEGAVASTATDTPTETQSASTPEHSDAQDTASPAVRKLLQEHNLELSTVAHAVVGTGKNGRLLKEDVLAYLERAPSQTPVTEQPTTPTPTDSDLNTTFNTEPQKLTHESDRPEKRVLMTSIRQQIADRAIRARLSTSTITTFGEVNMQPILKLRDKHSAIFEETHGTPLSKLSFFVKACVEALKRYPTLNASIEDDHIVYHGYQDIGVTLGSSRGQLVPVLRNAEHMSVADIEQTLALYRSQVEDGSIDFEALQGGTFTLTNSGLIGSSMSTPILNSPQSAVLGLHKIEERPVVVDGEIVIRPMMNLALSYDQRLIDGEDAVSFLVLVKSLLEDPARILLGV